MAQVAAAAAPGAQSPAASASWTALRTRCGPVDEAGRTVSQRSGLSLISWNGRAEWRRWALKAAYSPFQLVAILRAVSPNTEQNRVSNRTCPPNFACTSSTRSWAM